jgi:hypothetical protein
MATTSIFIRRKSKKTGMYRIIVRYTHNRQQFDFPSGLNILEENWDKENGKVFWQYSQFRVMNAKIEAIKTKLLNIANTLITEGTDPTIDIVKEIYYTSGNADVKVPKKITGEELQEIAQQKKQLADTYRKKETFLKFLPEDDLKDDDLVIQMVETSVNKDADLKFYPELKGLTDTVKKPFKEFKELADTWITLSPKASKKLF